ncbi:MAG: aldehyde dehydrogenase [Pseudomonadota bacterium]
MAVRSFQLQIDNEDTPAEDGTVFERRSPITGEVVTKAASAKAADVDRAVLSAQTAFPAWSEKGPSDKRAVLNACADALEARVEDFVAIGTSETGSTELWYRNNVKIAASMLREAASMTTQIKGEIIPANKPGTLSMGYRQPIGVLVGMAPWNAPIILGVRSFAMPLACGNTVVMKASEKCPGLHRLIGACMAEGGLPPGVLNILTHSAADGPEVVNALVDHPLTRRINFTGSTRVGQIIAERAAKHLKPCLLELGGKAPFLVLEDADIDAAVRAAAFGAFMNQGQICMSTEKIIVVDAVADAFEAAFKARVESLTVGTPEDKGSLASVADRDTVDHLSNLVSDAVSKGAATYGGAVPEAGTIMPAIVVSGVTPEMDIYSTETFGPVTTVVRARDENHAVELANDTEYGLTSAVFTRDTQRGLSVAKRLETGIAHINGPTVGDEAQMPFGGTKASGYGRFGGTASIAEFTGLRWITIEDPNQPYPI